MFLTIATNILLGMDTNLSFQEKHDIFEQKFGVNARLTETLWNLLCEDRLHLRHRKAEGKHLLWALLFLFTYPCEKDVNKIIKTTHNTFSKWVWIIIKEIASLNSKIVSKIEHI